MGWRIDLGMRDPNHVAIAFSVGAEVWVGVRFVVGVAVKRFGSE